MYRRFILMVLAVSFLASCVQDDDFETPNTTVTEPELEGEVISISSVLGTAAQNEGDLYTYEETDLYVEGYVISSDEAGNFYRELIIQDNPENPTAGLKVSITVNDLYTKYEIGRKIYIALEGFTVGTSNGVVTLGIPDRIYIDPAPAQFENKIFRSAEVAEIVPLELEISEFTDAYENLFIQLNNVQFAKSELKLSFASEATDEYDGERTLESCTTDNTTIFSTSTFADFASISVPQGSGSISGILSRTFEDDAYIISVNTVDSSTINMEGERCDPEPAEPGLVQPPFNEDFESQNSSSDLAIDGWVNVNANYGERVYTVAEFGGNKYAQTSAYNSDENPYEAWLITPGVDLTSSTTATLSFDTKDGYNNGAALTTYITTSFDGDINNSIWTELTGINYSSGNSSGYADNFVPSGDIDLSAYAGQTVYIAFKYLGGDPNTTTTYQIDNVSLTAN
ncbi:protein of unknown function [Mesonia phycicola]|uniref:DUF5689 domain-containing protein n=2 Tax=Mesonia phycicola TaxID=579105 RepID=A0A1M6EEP0_9FLAO|nr:protein of unknown function [Mesonia phycicola]